MNKLSNLPPGVTDHAIELNANPQREPGTWTYGQEFEPGRYGLTRVRSIACDGAVIAHVNCAFGDGEEQAKLIVDAPAMMALLIDVNNFWAGGDCPKELWDRMQALIGAHEGRRP